MLSQRDRMGTRAFLCHLNFTNLHFYFFFAFPSWDPVKLTRVLSSNGWEHVEMKQWQRRSENQNIHSDDFSLISGENRCKSCGPVIYFFIKYDVRDIDSSVWTAGCFWWSLSVLQTHAKHSVWYYKLKKRKYFGLDDHGIKKKLNTGGNCEVPEGNHWLTAWPRGSRSQRLTRPRESWPSEVQKRPNRQPRSQLLLRQRPLPRLPRYPGSIKPTEAEKLLVSPK